MAKMNLGHSKTKAINAAYTSFSVYDQDKDIVANGDAQSNPTSTTQMFQGYQTYSKTPNFARIEEHICQGKQRHKERQETPNRRHAFVITNVAASSIRHHDG
jgi:hypothetical protein